MKEGWIRSSDDPSSNINTSDFFLFIFFRYQKVFIYFFSNFLFRFYPEYVYLFYF
jgi:hypothetical protein